MLLRGTGEWCEHASKNLGQKLSDVGYDDLHKAQDACAAEKSMFKILSRF